MDEKNKTAEAEEKVLAFWKENKIFEKTLEKDAPNGEFVFYEGPPTANGKPGIHHIESRSFKDLIPRYKTMRGYHVRRKAGWDTHGLPVEIEVEKQLGITNKKEIEEYGIDKFNAKCKESVLQYIDEWKDFTDRIGYWVDHDSTYFTFTNEYMESVWSVIKHVWDRDLIYKDYKVLPWCPRCGTPLSSHELAQGYKEVKDESVYIKFKVKNPKEHDLPENTYLLAWTTTPWTLPGNVALAVGKDIDYVLTKDGYILAKERAEDFEIEKEFKGNDLLGIEYEALYDYLKDNIPANQADKMKNAYKVYEADFVSTEDGTGIVHTAVMYGVDDFDLGTKLDLPKFHLVNEEGRFIKAVTDFADLTVTRAGTSKKVTEDLDSKGLLFKTEMIEHTYPFCWRCKEKLIYYARDSWYIAMSTLRDDLVKENDEIHWEPEYIKDGRFGGWLRDVKDWAISRNRYWGTPIPIWECAECDERKIVGSIKELEENAVDDIPDDLHKPYIDDVKFKCGCGGEMTRIPEVMDVWFDSGAMPFAQDHYPFENKEFIDGAGYPADYICEAIDQTRGWFYTLHAVGILMGRGKAYKNVISLGHILDEKGKKMSKSVGNIVEPWGQIHKYGVDALRYWMFTVNNPGESKSFDEKGVDEIVKKNIGRLNNVYSFYDLYRSHVKHEASNKSDNVLDQWIIARLHELISTTTEEMEKYRVDKAARPFTDFIDDFSTWYIRRSRDRYKGDDEEDKKKALGTTRYVLFELLKTIAPFMPFLAEDLYQKMGGEKESVHLEEWPEAKEFDKNILDSMERTRNIVSLALEMRTGSGIKVRQPLQKLTVTGDLDDSYLTLIKEEMNVKEVVKGDKLELDIEITPELKEEGEMRELLRFIQQERKSAGLTPDDEAILTVNKFEGLITKFEKTIKKTALLKEIIYKDNDGTVVKVDGEEVSISITT